MKNEDNSLNLHLVTSRSKHLDSSAFVEPSPEIVDADSAYVRLGKLRSINKEITLKVQREIVRYVTGTHQTFAQNHKEIGERRRRTWRKWVAGEADGNIFHEKDLPIIAYTFWFVWDAPIPEGTPLKSITPTVLGLVKREIIELLVRMFMIPADSLECIMVRRSRRGMSVRDDDIVPAASRKRKRLTPQQVSSPEDDDTDEDVCCSVLHLFNLGELKELVRTGHMKEVGRREVALLSAHAGMSRQAANFIISGLGGLPYSIEDYEEIEAIPKSDMGKKARQL